MTYPATVYYILLRTDTRRHLLCSSYCSVSYTFWCLVLLGVSYFLVAHTSRYLVLRDILYVPVSHTSWYLVLPDISYCLVSRIVWYLVLPDISYVRVSRRSSHTHLQNVVIHAPSNALPVLMLRQVYLHGQKWWFCVGGGAKTAT